MRIETRYIADDGTEFRSITECRNYEESLKEKIRNEKEQHNKCIQQAMCELDDAIWERFYPGSTYDTSERDPSLAFLWLQSDISYILSDDSFDLDQTKEVIVSMIEAADYGKEILGSYIHMDEQEREALIRRDFQEAFRHVKYGGDLGSDIRYALSDRDLRHLAELHKANHCRKKIEGLLTACNYHYECGRFANRQYDEFLQKH